MVINSSSSDSDIVQALVDGSIKFYQLETLIGDYARAARLRLSALRKITGQPFKNVGEYSIDPENVRPNIENMFGTVQIPLGFAGPLKVNGEYADGDFILPLATTEGSLVASINRGCSAINKGGGATVRIFQNTQTRSLLFKARNVIDVSLFREWIKKNEDEIKNIASTKSSFLSLEGMQVFSIGNKIWLRLSAFTGDAMGMNMVTIAGDIIGKYIASKLEGVKFISASGNACVDKKPSAMNMILGRGKYVTAETRISKDIFKKYFKTDADSVVELNIYKNYMGSALSGSYGFNAHFANMIAALFIATGQDSAHIVEGSIGFTDVSVDGDDIMFSVTLPSLQVATVGGGTRVETQQECLSLLGVEGSGDPPGTNSLKLSEIIAAGVLAGEMSLLGALSAHHLSEAHQRHNR